MSRVEALYRAHAKAVRAELRRRGVGDASAEDLVQEVFLVVHRRHAEIPAEPNIAKQWLLESAKKHAANWRRLFRHRYEKLDMAAVANAVAEPRDPEAHAALCDLVCRAFRKLAPPERELIARHHLCGESFSELAGQLCLSRSAVHVRCRRVEECMRREMWSPKIAGGPGQQPR